ncbi:MAG: 30S ribosomal protein S20 [Kiritimatiellia bacterium]|jgi:small subunit ribosomal protein S20|nr:30S ribosomal protein S20 [Kiritimatiellia bacterium]MDP6809314.1 30S ribosomal protein S20 [Kiritimatiellia bacterium]MDP7023052.1 30S ribosomal protein S20 [Kiritimatiellia bacterium]
MPNIKSAKKRLRTSEKARQGNKSVKSRINTARAKFYKAVVGDDKAAAQTALNSFCSALDMGVKRGAIKKNNANRRKSRARLRMNALLAA